MATLHIFNPWHDEALAAGSPYYCPDKAARQLAADLAEIPKWWAKQGDYILIPQDMAPSSPNQLHPTINFITEKGLPQIVSVIHKISPWGWDALLVNRLTKWGVPKDLLPNADQIAKLRDLSSRQTTVAFLQRLRKRLPDHIGESFWCTDMEEVEKKVSALSLAMLKAPWSCSGRGVFRTNWPISKLCSGRIQKILRQQGGIEVEPFYQRTQDFAMEFEVGTEVTYKGLSVFKTHAGGAYLGNLITSEDNLTAELPNEVAEMLPQTKNAIISLLEEMYAPHYTGPVGIDMMVVEKGNRKILHPCIEVNLRNTMGYVACMLHQRMPEIEGILSIEPLQTLQQDAICLTPGGKHLQAIITHRQ